MLEIAFFVYGVRYKELRPVGNFAYCFLNRGGICRPNEARDFLAMAYENQSWPELHSKGAPQPAALSIFDLDMAQARVFGEG